MAVFTRLLKLLDSYPSRLEDRRARYLAGSTFILAEVGRRFVPDLKMVLDLIAAVGLFCFLVWFISGVLKTKIELQDAAKRALDLYDVWRDEVTLHSGVEVDEAKRLTADSRQEFQSAAKEYASTLTAARTRGWAIPSAAAMIRAEDPLACSGWIENHLRPQVRKHILRRIF